MVRSREINEKSYLFICIIIETFLVKALQYKVLPNKYFYDSGKILTIMNGNQVTDKAYSYAANFFNSINIFGIQTLQQWSIVIACVFTVVLISILSKEKKFSFPQELFILGSIGLLNVYVFNLSKDIIQFIFFLIIYMILSNKKMKNVTKLILSSIVLMYVALAFRVYFAIMVMLMITIYVVYQCFIRNKTLKKSTIIKIIILTLIAFFIEVFVVQMISTENYNSIINARSGANETRQDTVDAVTMINDLLGANTNYIKFILNYLINTVRMMFPVELLLKGIKYIPFVIYQIYVTYNILKSSKKINDQNILWITTAISFMMISIIFEPDFGSFVRHESALILILLKINKINCEIPEEQEETS